MVTVPIIPYYSAIIPDIREIRIESSPEAKVSFDLSLVLLNYLDKYYYQEIGGNGKICNSSKEIKIRLVFTSDR